MANLVRNVLVEASIVISAIATIATCLLVLFVGVIAVSCGVVLATSPVAALAVFLLGGSAAAAATIMAGYHSFNLLDEQVHKLISKSRA